MFVVQSGENLPDVYQMGEIPEYWKKAGYKRTMFLEWDEHCLECGAPECYSTCGMYRARSDGKCRRTAYGLKMIANEDAGSVRLRFLPWGKLQAGIADRGFDGAGRRKYVKYCKVMSKAADRVAYTKKLVRGLYMTGRRIMKYTAPGCGLEQYDVFVFRALSYTKEKTCLIFEFCGLHGEICYKYSIAVSMGPNEFKIPVSHFSGYAQKIALVRMYPENNTELELEIHDMDFVMEEPAKEVKCLIWDCDNTMWKGVLAEGTDEPVTDDIREIITTLDLRGIVQSVASRNDYSCVRQKLEKEGLWEYFLYPQITWESKSKSIKNIMQSLNIGTDTAAFVDDSFFEREEVGRHLPRVRLFCENDLMFLTEYRAFAGADTKEARSRRKMYQQEERRNTDRQTLKTDERSFLRSCGIRIEIFQPQGEEVDRCIELLGRTNQFNLSQNKYTRQELLQIMDQKDSLVLAFSCEDKYGSYGIVGVLILKCGKEIFLKDFVMSCRVAGKTIESAVFGALMKAYDADAIRARFRKTDRNGVLLTSLLQAGYQLCKDELYAGREDLTETFVTCRFAKREQAGRREPEEG